MFVHKHFIYTGEISTRGFVRCGAGMNVNCDNFTQHFTSEHHSQKHNSADTIMTATSDIYSMFYPPLQVLLYLPIMGRSTLFIFGYFFSVMTTNVYTISANLLHFTCKNTVPAGSVATVTQSNNLQCNKLRTKTVQVVCGH